MNVLISAFLCIPNRGSEANNGWNWTLEMARAGHEVWCFTTPVGKPEIEKELAKFPGLRINFVYIKPPGWVRILHRIQSSIPALYDLYYYCNYLAWQAAAAKAARKMDREVNFDLVHHVTLGSFQLASGMWRLHKPFVFGPVGGGNFPPVAFKKYFAEGWRTERTRKLISNVLLLLNRNTKRTARNAKVLVTNKDTYKMASRVGATNIDYFLDAGLPDSFFPEVRPVRKHNGVLKILWVGRMQPRKGLPLVLDALSKVRKDLPFKLTILGDGQMGPRIRPLIETLGLNEKVDWRGLVPWEEVRKAYIDHNVFMFCSLRDSFGAQFLEAMASGMPIITLDHQGAGDCIPDGAGIKVPVTTPEETTLKLAAAVEHMYDNPEILDAMGACGYEFAKNQTWEHRVERMQAIYYSVVQGLGQVRVSQREL
jgi:glycosyltransferase involved in cell wall biosynthesis